MRLHTVVISSLFAISANVSAGEHCQFGAEKIAVGSSITIRDPFLVKESADYYISRGATSEDAYEMANSSDWTVVVLECQKEYLFNESVNIDKPLSTIKQGNPVLVPIDHQKEWVDELITKTKQN